MKILIVLLVLVALVSGALFFAVQRKIKQVAPDDTAALLDAVRQPEAGASVPAPIAPAPAPPRAVPPAAPALIPADPAVQLASDIKRLSTLFAERWGTFSNQQSLSNTASLTSLMTRAVQRFAAGEEARLRAQHPDPAVLYRIQTRALNAEEVRFSMEGGEAIFLVATQRVEVSGAASNRRTFYEDLEVRLIKENGLWKVAGAYWKEQQP